MLCEISNFGSNPHAVPLVNGKHTLLMRGETKTLDIPTDRLGIYLGENCKVKVRLTEEQAAQLGRKIQCGPVGPEIPHNFSSLGWADLKRLAIAIDGYNVTNKKRALEIVMCEVQRRRNVENELHSTNSK